MIYFYSGYTGFGGSTYIIGRVVQLLNEAGVPALFYGDNAWFEQLSPYNKAKGFPDLQPEDTLACHFHNLIQRPDVRRSVFVLHEETWNFRRGRYLCPVCDTVTVGRSRHKPAVCKSCHKRRANFIGQAAFDQVVFSSEAHAKKSLKAQRFWGPHVVIPNPIEVNFEWRPPTEPAAGVIGTINARKDTLRSIRAAQDAGYERVLLYGAIEQGYFEEHVEPMLSESIQYMGVEMDREKMYGSISEVFHYSTKEQALLVLGECKKLGIPFHASDAVHDWDLYSDESIVNAWKELLCD